MTIINGYVRYLKYPSQMILLYVRGREISEIYTSIEKYTRYTSVSALKGWTCIIEIWYTCRMLDWNM